MQDLDLALCVPGYAWVPYVPPNPTRPIQRQPPATLNVAVWSAGAADAAQSGLARAAAGAGGRAPEGEHRCQFAQHDHLGRSQHHPWPSRAVIVATTALQVCVRALGSEGGLGAMGCLGWSARSRPASFSPHTRARRWRPTAQVGKPAPGGGARCRMDYYAPGFQTKPPSAEHVPASPWPHPPIPACPSFLQHGRQPCPREPGGECHVQR